MDRREALRTTSFVVGYSLTASAIAAALQGCKPETGTAVEAATTQWEPQFFNQEQIELIAELSETIIPETATPGAKSALVHQFIDDTVQNFLRPMEQYQFVQGLEDVQARAQSAYGKKFEACSAEERTVLLLKLEEDTKNDQEAENVQGQPFFSMLKGMTYQGYFTSEKVGKEVLAFDPVPGDYKGCIPLADVGKLWTVD